MATTTSAAQELLAEMCQCVRIRLSGRIGRNEVCPERGPGKAPRRAADSFGSDLTCSHGNRWFCDRAPLRSVAPQVGTRASPTVGSASASELSHLMASPRPPIPGQISSTGQGIRWLGGPTAPRPERLHMPEQESTRNEYCTTLVVVSGASAARSWTRVPKVRRAFNGVALESHPTKRALRDWVPKAIPQLPATPTPHNAAASPPPSVAKQPTRASLGSLLLRRRRERDTDGAIDKVSERGRQKQPLTKRPRLDETAVDAHVLTKR